VEVNPDLVAIVQEREQFNGGIYSSMPEVRVLVEEGRRFVRLSPQRWDLIILALPVTKSSRSVEGFALTENYLYTVESLGEYLDHLAPGGRLLLVAHHQPELYRLVRLALEAFERRGEGAGAAMGHLWTLWAAANPTLVLKREPLDLEEVERRLELMRQGRLDQVPFYLPRLRETGGGMDPGLESDAWLMLDRRLLALEHGELGPEQALEIRGFELGPVTDDRPFFYRFEPGIPAPLPHLALAASGALALLLLVGGRRISGSGRAGARGAAPAARPATRMWLLTGALLGAAFMLVEIALFQKLMLYLGRPHLALTVLLTSLLVGAGAGSFASARFAKRLGSKAALACLGSASLAALCSLAARALAASVHPGIPAAVALALMGVAMGMPFPLCLRLMAARGLARAVPLVWGANGIASVLGSVSAVIAGMLWGFSRALWLAAALYVLAGAALLAAGVERHAAPLARAEAP
jgi:hypothetical protein